MGVHLGFRGHAAVERHQTFKSTYLALVQKIPEILHELSVADPAFALPAPGGTLGSCFFLQVFASFVVAIFSILICCFSSDPTSGRYPHLARERSASLWGCNNTKHSVTKTTEELNRIGKCLRLYKEAADGVFRFACGWF